jgi:CDP-diacylglycerol--glycerol-3-phosphate 3-phosphatidyltransferase
MTHLPNTITLLRIAGSLGLLLCDVTGVAYWITYVFCGISGIADGWLANHLISRSRHYCMVLLTGSKN